MRGFVVALGFKKCWQKSVGATRTQARRRKILKQAANRHFRRAGEAVLCTSYDAS